MSTLHELSEEIAAWIRRVTASEIVEVERRSGGASRAGYAIDTRNELGVVRPLWLRMDTGFGPNVGTVYTLQREAAVYRALEPTAVRVPRIVAVHPSGDAFLSERVFGRNWFSELTDPGEREAVASDFMGQVAALHRIDATTFDIRELGDLSTITAHVRGELAIWTDRHERGPNADDPLTALALKWLAKNVPDETGERPVLVQGDTGPGNFMYAESRVVAVLDWEMAHFGDPHDDLGWLYVRDLQEPFPDMPARIREYQAKSGVHVDTQRLRYFRVFAQTRCAIGTMNNFFVRDAHAEIANQLIYSQLHHRLLAEAMADVLEVDVEAAALDASATTDHSWLFDVVLDEMREVVVPGVHGDFALRRAKGIARLMKYLRELDRLGPAVDDARAARLRTLLGRDVGSLIEAEHALTEAIRSDRVTDADALRYCAFRAACSTQLARPAMGALADRHYAPLP